MRADNALRALKATSLQFRSLASIALRSNGEDARVNLRRLLAFVESTPILREEVTRAPKPAVDAGELWKSTRESRNRLSFPDDALEELGLLDALLHQLAEDDSGDFWNQCYGYAGKHGVSECINEALSDTVGRYTTHLRQVLELALLDSSDPAYDNRRVEVHVSGGTNQLNVAQDNARVEATQVAGADAVSILEAAGQLATEAAAFHSRTSAIEAAQVAEIATAVVQAMRNAKPSRFTLQAAKERLETLAAGATVIGALAPHIHNLVALIATYLGT